MATKRATTLLEIMLVTALSLLILTIVLTVFRQARLTSSSASSSFVLGQDAALSFEKLRKDFVETSLQSVRLAPQPKAGEIWVSLARAADERGNLKINRYGTPDWNQMVCYVVENDSDNDGITRLLRYQMPHTFSGRAPVASPKLSLSGTPQVVLVQLLAPGWQIEPGAAQESQLVQRSAGIGGFQVRFVRRAEDFSETFSSLSPNQNDDAHQKGWSQGSTPMVDLQVSLVERNASTGKISSLVLPLRITPRH